LRAGFFGGVLKRRLLDEGYTCINLDLLPDSDQHPGLYSIEGDLRDKPLLARTFSEHKFDAVFHCAAMLAHGKMDDQLLWTSNVDGTVNLAEAARDADVRKFVFISTNCLWASNLGHPVKEDEQPNPIELYGKSKLAAEQGYALAQNNLGVFYENGRGGLAKDEREAARLFRLSAEQGNELAKQNLARLGIR